MKRLKILAIGICALSLSSCAVNTIRLDRATAMGTAGGAATEGTRKLIEQVRTANREVLIDLVATDVRCALPSPVIAGGQANDGSELCRAGMRQANDFEVRRLAARDFEPSLAVIESIATYLGAVDAIVTRKPLDFAGEVAKAESTLRGLLGDAAAITSVPAIPELTADQKAAINGTLGLLSEILDEAERVGDLRQIEVKLDQKEFEENLITLEKINNMLVRNLNGQIMNQRTLMSVQLMTSREKPFDQRKALATRQLNLIDAQSALPELSEALHVAVEAFRKAHADYRLLLFDSAAPLTAAEKRKAARITEARILSALHNLSSLIKAF